MTVPQWSFWVINQCFLTLSKCALICQNNTGRCVIAKADGSSCCCGCSLCSCYPHTPNYSLIHPQHCGGGWLRRAGYIWAARTHLFSRKVQTGTLKRASGFKRYSLSFLMERNRKWRCGGGLCDLYAASVEGQKSKSISLSTPLVCSRIIPLCFSHLLSASLK